MKTTLLIILLPLVAALSVNQAYAAGPSSKVYVALEKSWKIVVIDGGTNELLNTINLSENRGKKRTSFTAHNVQVSPDGKTLWVTANAGVHEDHAEHAEGAGDTTSHPETNTSEMAAHSAPASGISGDEVVVIDRETDTVVKRIPVAEQAHLAHVVLTPDGKYAYVTAQKANAVYKVDTTSYAVKKIGLPDNSGPHGLRIDPAGKHAYIALMTGKGLGILDIPSDDFRTVSLDWAAVQTAVLPNGKRVFVSLYDTKKIAVYNTETGKRTYIQLPKTSQGPVQLYPAPDWSALYVADQGYLSGRPANTRVYRLDFFDMKIRTIAVGKAPHGIVVSPEGNRAYVTNLAGGEVSVINTQSNRETKKIRVGEEPNGITVWSETRDYSK